MLIAAAALLVGPNRSSVRAVARERSAPREAFSPDEAVARVALAPPVESFGRFFFSAIAGGLIGTGAPTQRRTLRRVRLALVLPGIAIGFVAVVILGPGNTRPVLGARVYAAPPTLASGPAIGSARIVATWRLGEAETPASDLPLEVVTGTHVLRVTTGTDGVADVTLEPGAAPGAVVEIVHAGRMLAADALDPRGQPRSELDVRGMSGRTEGELEVRVRPLRGQLVPPFAETVVLESFAAGRVHLVGEITGATPTRVELDLEKGAHATSFELHPEALRVDIQVKARAEDGREGSFEGSFETIPGAMWLDPKSPSDRIALVAPAPRKAAYVSFLGTIGRVGGATVALHEDSDGFYRGTVARPRQLGPDARLDVVVAGDPQELGVGTVLWPVSPSPQADAPVYRWVDETHETSLPMRLVRVLDGMPAALTTESARVTRMRRLAIAVAVLVGLLEIALLVRDGRRAQHELDAHFAAQADAATAAEEGDAIRHVAKSASRSGNVTVTLLGAVVALAFGMIAAFVVAR